MDAMNIYQPDVAWCGGLTQLVEIFRLGREYGVTVYPHRGAEVWSLHAIVALAVEPLAESGRPWLEWVGGSEVANGQARLVSAVPYGDWEGHAVFGFGVELPSVKPGRGHGLGKGLPEGWRPFVVQTGMGTSIHGSDPTKAAIRAVDEAIRHNSLTGLYDLLRSTANN